MTRFLHEHAVSKSDPIIVEHINNFPKLLDAGVTVSSNKVIDFLVRQRGNLLKGLVVGRDAVWHKTFEEEFAYFVNQTSFQWLQFNKDCSVFFNNPLYTNYPGFKILRHQNTKICGTHAAVAFLHYMMAI